VSESTAWSFDWVLFESEENHAWSHVERYSCWMWTEPSACESLGLISKRTHTQTKRYMLTMCSWSHCAWVSMWLIHLLSVSSIKWQLHLYLALRVVRISWQPRWELLSKVLEFTTAFKNRYCIIYLFLPCILNFGFINLRRIAGFWNRSIL
jgi:hypothetical protein